MKIDNDYISTIIIAMKANESYDINTSDLIKKLNITDEEVHKFYDHLKYMRDNSLIKSEQYNLGFGEGGTGNYIIYNCKINLTNKEFTTEKRGSNMTTNNINIHGDVHNSPIKTGDNSTQSTEYNITNNEQETEKPKQHMWKTIIYDLLIGIIASLVVSIGIICYKYL